MIISPNENPITELEIYDQNVEYFFHGLQLSGMCMYVVISLKCIYKHTFAYIYFAYNLHRLCVCVCPLMTPTPLHACFYLLQTTHHSRSLVVFVSKINPPSICFSLCLMKNPHLLSVKFKNDLFRNSLNCGFSKNYCSIQNYMFAILRRIAIKHKNTFGSNRRLGKTQFLKDVNGIGFIHAEIHDPIWGTVVHYPEE